MLAFTPEGDRLVTGGPGQSLRFLSLPDLRETRRVELGGVRSSGWVLNETLVTFTRMSSEDARPLIRAWPLAEGEPKVVGRRDWAGPWDIDASGRIAFGRERTLFVRPLDASPPSAERVIGRLGADLADVALLGEKGLVSVDTSGEVRLWSGDGFSSRVLAPADETFFDILAVDREGRRLAVGRPRASVDLWDLRDPPDATPVRLDRPDPFFWLTAAFDPHDTWLATNNAHTVAFWSLASLWRRTLRHQGGLAMTRIRFSSDGRRMGSSAGPSLWSLDPEDGVRRDLVSPDFARDQPCGDLAFSPDGEQVLMGTANGGAFLVPVGSGSPRRLETGWEGKVQWTIGTTFDASGRRAAASPFDMNPSLRDPKLRAIRVWDLPSGEGRTYSLAHLTDDSWWGFDWLRFAPDGSLLAAGIGAGGVTRLVLPSEADGVVSSETLHAAGGSGFDLSADGRHLLVWASRTPATEAKEELLVLDLVDRTSRRIETHGQRVSGGAIDPSGRVIVTGDTEGVVRVGPATGEEPHLLLGGHQGVAWTVAISPDGRWIASVGDDAIHLWPTPDVAEPPLHTLPHAELMAKLDALTNLRVVRDPSSSTGWTLDVGPFPGWEEVPTW